MLSKEFFGVRFYNLYNFVDTCADLSFGDLLRLMILLWNNYCVRDGVFGSFISIIVTFDD